MSKALLTLVLLLVSLLTYFQSRRSRQLYPGLFEAVPPTGIFPDHKIFVDASSSQGPELIMEEQNAQKSRRDFDLPLLVNHNLLPGTYNEVISVFK